MAAGPDGDTASRTSACRTAATALAQPILSGDHSDPTVSKDGRGDYTAHSSFFSYPGLPIRHSPDLVNWKAVGPAPLIVTAFALEGPTLIRHGGC